MYRLLHRSQGRTDIPFCNSCRADNVHHPGPWFPAERTGSPPCIVPLCHRPAVPEPQQAREWHLHSGVPEQLPEQRASCVTGNRGGSLQADTAHYHPGRGECPVCQDVLPRPEESCCLGYEPREGGLHPTFCRQPAACREGRYGSKDCSLC